VALKKSDLYSSLWASCDELRGGMDASQYKDYVLVMLFIKYVSDKYVNQTYAPITIPKGSSFADMVALKGKTDIGDQINKKIIAPLATANKLSDMPDFNDATKLGAGKELVERLTNLITIFQNPGLDFSKNRADGDDILGDAYEYLMRHFATESGKSKGQFYTPAEVSRVMAKLIGINNSKASNKTSVYDPTCGSGSLLLKVADEAAHGTNVKVTLFGQENESVTAGLARMNMILHNNPTAEIKQGNTITNPQFKDGATKIKTFDYVVANPPFSDKRWSTGLGDDNDFGRFATLGRPPAKQGDYAYLLHIVASLKTTGKGACILPHGVLFRGNAEAVIRKNLVQRGYIKAIVGLPANLFYGTGIPACIVVIDKENASARKGIFMIDASKGFIKDGSKNRLRDQDIHRIVDVYAKQANSPGFSRMVPVSEIEDSRNDFNLNLPRYIDSTDVEDLRDIDAHLNGGIPNHDLDLLDGYWKVIPGVRTALFSDSTRKGYSNLGVPNNDIKSTIYNHAEFTAYNDTVRKLFTRWKTKNKPLLANIKLGDKPKALIELIAEDLLKEFKKAALLDPYDVYQHLMNYWTETMQDDVYIVAIDGWLAGAKPRELLQVKNKNNKLEWAETEDYLVGRSKFKSDLIPNTLLIQRYFATKQKALETLEAEKSRIEQELDEQKEEHGVEGGLLEDVAEETDGKIKITAKKIQSWLKENAKDPELADERKAVKAYETLLDQQTELKNHIKTAKDNIDVLIAKKYASLTEDEIRVLVLEDKWFEVIAVAIESELNRVSMALTSRIRELADRYETPMPLLMNEIRDLTTRVDNHLKKMGAKWN